MNNAVDGNGILVFLDRDLKAPQPALTKGLKLGRAAGMPVTVMVNSDSAAMRRAVGLDEERRQAAEKQIHKAWDKRIDALCGDHKVEKRIISSRDSERALRERCATAARPFPWCIPTRKAGYVAIYSRPATGC